MTGCVNIINVYNKIFKLHNVCVRVFSEMLRNYIVLLQTVGEYLIRFTYNYQKVHTEFMVDGFTEI